MRIQAMILNPDWIRIRNAALNIVIFVRIPGHTKGRPQDIDREVERRRRAVNQNREGTDEVLVTQSSGIVFILNWKIVEV